MIGRTENGKKTHEIDGLEGPVLYRPSDFKLTPPIRRVGLQFLADLGLNRLLLETAARHGKGPADCQIVPHIGRVNTGSPMPFISGSLLEYNYQYPPDAPSTRLDPISTSIGVWALTSIRDLLGQTWTFSDRVPPEYLAFSSSFFKRIFRRYSGKKRPEELPFNISQYFFHARSESRIARGFSDKPRYGIIIPVGDKSPEDIRPLLVKMLEQDFEKRADLKLLPTAVENKHLLKTKQPAPSSRIIYPNDTDPEHLVVVRDAYGRQTSPRKGTSPRT